MRSSCTGCYDLIPDENSCARTARTCAATIGVLQALRLALFQHMFICAVSVPAFSRANDISRDDVLEMVFTLRIDEALAQLRRAYPTEFPRITDFSVERTERLSGQRRGRLRRIARATSSTRSSVPMPFRCGFRTAIANLFGAHG